MDSMAGFADGLEASSGVGCEFDPDTDAGTSHGGVN
jgi:hypothetical protein